MGLSTKSYFSKKNIEKPIDKPIDLCYNVKVARKATPNGPLVKRLRRRPLTAKAWVRFP